MSEEECPTNHTYEYERFVKGPALIPQMDTYVMERHPWTEKRYKHCPDCGRALDYVKKEAS